MPFFLILKYFRYSKVHFIFIKINNIIFLFAIELSFLCYGCKFTTFCINIICTLYCILFYQPSTKHSSSRLLDQYQPNNSQESKNMFKDLLDIALKCTLEVEMSKHHGYFSKLISYENLMPFMSDLKLLHKTIIRRRFPYILSILQKSTS